MRIPKKKQIVNTDTINKGDIVELRTFSWEDSPGWKAVVTYSYNFGGDCIIVLIEDWRGKLQPRRISRTVSSDSLRKCFLMDESNLTKAINRKWLEVNNVVKRRKTAIRIIKNSSTSELRSIYNRDISIGRPVDITEKHNQTYLYFLKYDPVDDDYKTGWFKIEEIKTDHLCKIATRLLHKKKNKL